MQRPLTQVAVIGAGNLRCGTHILASLLTQPWAEHGELVLYDEHEEALDLFDRLARVLAQYKDLEIVIRSTSSPHEATLGADTVLLAFGLGVRRHDYIAWRDSNPLADPIAGRCVMLNPFFERINEWLHQVGPSRVINLVMPVSQTARLLAYDAIHIDWPEALPDDARVPMAHQVLRWVHGDEPPFEPLKLAGDSPISDALDGLIDAQRLFDPGALSKWLLELERTGSKP